MTAPAELGRDRRVRSQRDFSTIYAERRSIRNRNLTFCWRPAEGTKSRLGLSVGKRLGNAVARNRIKRIIREVFRRECNGLSKAFDIIVIPRTYATASDFREMTSSMKHLLRKLERHWEEPSES